MGSVFTCKLNPCCGDRHNCEPPQQYYASEPTEVRSLPSPRRSQANALSTPTAPELAVKVKPLEWRGDWAGEGEVAQTDIKNYRYQRFGDGFDLLIDGHRTKPYIHGVRETHPTIEAAKAAAQADYEARILSALSSVREP
jgi:hypothetical protein